MRNIIYLMLMLLIYSVNITAQVTIGADTLPRAGAGLDLRSSDKGLLLPNVALSDPATDFQLEGDDGTTAAGMVVYNTGAELDGPGVYVWDGSRWILITCVPEMPGTIDLSSTAVNLNGTFTASVPEATGPAAPTSYIWTLPDGLTGTSATRTVTITGATAGTYNSGTIKVAATNACGTGAEQTGTAAVTVRACSAAPTISSPETDQTPANQFAGATCTMTVTANIYGTSSVTYRWQSSANGADGWENVSPGGNSNAYNAPTAAANVGITYYRCVVTTACGEAISPTWKITVVDCSAAPTIISSSTDETQTTTTGVAVSALWVTADGKGATPTFQWESSADLSTWDPIESATGDTFTVPVANAGTTYYHCVVTTGCGDATSKVFTVNVCGTAIQDSEGNWYCTGYFGDAGTWMTMNLRSTRNDVYTDLTENGAPGEDTSSKYYWYPGQNSSVDATTADDILDAHPEYGLLYTWAAASGRTGSDANEEGNTNHDEHPGICPAGWHLPSDMEWYQLEQVIAVSDANVYSTTGPISWNIAADAASWRGTHGSKMKSTTAVSSSYATNGTSNGLVANGFDALLVGVIDADDGEAFSYGEHTDFWSSSSQSGPNAWRRALGNSVELEIGVYRTAGSKVNMQSVRCKQNVSSE